MLRQSCFPLRRSFSKDLFLLGKVTQIEANDSVCQSHAGSFYFCATAKGCKQKHPARVPNRDWKPKDVCPVVQTADKFIAEVEPLLLGERYLTIEQVMSHFHISRRALQNYRDKGIIPYVSVGGSFFIPNPKSTRCLIRTITNRQTLKTSNENSVNFFTCVIN